MSSRWRSEPWPDGPAPAAAGLVGLVVAAHVASGWVAWASGVPLLDALLLPRDAATRIAVGGRSAAQVADGALWRLWTGVLLHGGPVHLVVNGLSLWVLGRLLEPLVGGLRLVGWFAAGGLAGAVASQAAGVVLSDGASGGGFALLGAAVVVGARRLRRLPGEDRRLVGGLALLLVANLGLTVALPFVDAAGHLGGLAAGLAVGAASPASRPGWAERGLWWGLLAACAGALAYGVGAVV